MSKKKGDCYFTAGRAIMDVYGQGEGEAFLVHAIVQGRGPLDGEEFGHAWIEIGPICYDFANGHRLMMTRDDFYRLGGVEEKPRRYAKYSPREAMKMMADSGNFGPWELEETEAERREREGDND